MKQAHTKNFSIMKTLEFKTATNYIHAERYLKEYRTYLQNKYGINFKGSQLTDEEIDTLQEYKIQLSEYSITLEGYVTQAR